MLARSIPVALSLIMSIAVYGQSIRLPGRVVIQNSEYETGTTIYVSDASIRAPFAKGETSDKDGRFALDLVGVENGTSVRISVEKTSLVVVNSMETDGVILGRGSELTVVMADADKLARAQMELYRISGESIALSFDRKMAALRDDNTDLALRLAAVGRERRAELHTMEEAIDQLANERDQAAAKAEGLARELAHVNIDEVSATYRGAYTAFRNGSLDSALMVLDRERLDAENATAMAQRKEGSGLMENADHSFRQLVQSYQLRSDVLQTRLDFPGAMTAMQRMCAIVEDQQDAFDRASRIRLLDGIGVLHEMMGAYDSAIAVLHRAEALARISLPADHPLTARVLRDICMVQNDRARFPEGIRAGEEAVAIAARALGPDHPEVAEAHQYLGMVLSSSGDHHGALAHYNIAQRIFRTDPRTSARSLGGLLTNVGLVHVHLGELDSAETSALLALDLLEQGALPGDPYVGIAYQVLGVVYQTKGEYDKAIAMTRSANAEMLRSLGAEHPRLGESYNSLGTAFWSKGDLGSAITAFRIAVDILERSLGTDHHVPAIVRSNMADVLREKGEPALAIAELRRSITVLNKVYGGPHANTAFCYNSLGISYEALEQWDDGRACYDTALVMFDHMPDVDSSAISHLHITRAFNRMETGHYADAVRDINAALAIDDRILGPGHPTTARARLHLGLAYSRLERPDSALMVLAISRAAFSKELGPEHPSTLKARLYSARAMALQQRWTEAMAQVDSVCDILARSPSPNPVAMGMAWSVRGKLLEDQDRSPEAVAAYSTALKILQGATGIPRSQISEQFTALGRAHYLAGDRASARSMLDSAMTIHGNAGAAWYLYRIANDEHDEDRALEELVRCARLRIAFAGTRQQDEEETLAALRSMAIKMDRKDLLDEFNLH